MAKPALFDFTTASASEIVAAIDSKITSAINLRAFRTRIGGAKKADKIYPATRQALELLKKLKKQAKDANTIRNILKPYSAELAAGRNVLDVIEPVLAAYRLYYASQGIGLMNEQLLLLKMIEAAGELEEITGQSILDMVAIH
ncbi:hypothetical protein F3J29_18060 [Enterobacter sp. Cy-643]|uniref:hypothetical protein n=1 Tax=Enterobacter sp. Cy-643 TaxID=2608346 RepID=UPI001423C9E5|nr:hypothetical protein [Enterobacter sp. Cy-643]NIF34038.1 hypothetical protein [Enterobacter sp. Cy-643]